MNNGVGKKKDFADIVWDAKSVGRFFASFKLDKIRSHKRGLVAKTV